MLGLSLRRETAQNVLLDNQGSRALRDIRLISPDTIDDDDMTAFMC